MSIASLLTAATDVRGRDRPAAGAVRSTAPPRTFRPDVQGLRAIAVSLVVIYHLSPSALPGGYVGVDVFFVISGFLITGHLLRTLQRTGRVGFVEFYGRRARRLMPAAVLVLAVTWVASRIALPATQLPDTAQQIRASALYFQNWVLAHDAVSYLKSDDAPSPVQHYWSLSVEEQFYLVWPLLFLIAGLTAAMVTRRVSSAGGDGADDRRALVARRTMLALALVVVAASLWYSIHETRANPPAAYFVTTTRMWELGLGGVLALLGRPLADRIGRVGPIAWVGLGLVIASAFVIKGSSAFPGSIALLPVGGAALLIACGSAAARLGPARLTSVRPMVFLGDISYSLYLWHWPVIVIWKAYSGGSIGVLDGLAIAGVSIVLAWLTKVFVEDRIRLAPFFARDKWRSLATVVAVALPVALGSAYIAGEPAPFKGQLTAKYPGAAVLAGAASTIPQAAAVPSPTQAVDDGSAYISGPRGCQTVQRSSVPAPCYYGDTTHPVKTVALVGDSVAGEWFTVINALAVKEHWKLVLDLHSLCPWSATMVLQPDGSRYTTCHDWGRTVLHDLLTKIKPDAVITSARPSLGTPSEPKPDAKSWSQIGPGMATYWKALAAHGIPVAAIQESPEMGKNIPDCLSGHDASVAGCSVPTTSAVKRGTPLVEAVDASGHAATLIDMNSLICGAKECSPVVGNVVVYRDSHHLTKTYTKTLAPYLDAKLLRVPALAR